MKSDIRREKKRLKKQLKKTQNTLDLLKKMQRKLGNKSSQIVILIYYFTHTQIHFQRDSPEGSINEE